MSFLNKLGAKFTNTSKTIPLPSDMRFISWDSFIEHQYESSTICHNPNDAAIITYTGGTTGGSKGVLLSNKGFVANIWQYCKMDIPLKRESKWMMVFYGYIQETWDI